MPARVAAISYYGHDATVRLVLDDGGEVLARTRGRVLTEVGARVALTVQGPVLGLPRLAPAVRPAGD